MELKQPYFSFVIFASTVMSVNHVKGYSDGCPNDRGACNSLLPTHEVLAQTTEIPYDVFVDGFPNIGVYDVTTNHTVTISGKSGTTFKGFLLQARNYSTSTSFTVIGSFLKAADAKATCAVVGGASVTQVNSSTKTSVEVLWIAPPNATGTVMFRGSVVQSNPLFWEFVPSVSSSASPPPETTGEPPVAIDITECGKTKGCYFSNCADPNDYNQCEYGVTWSATGSNGTEFELFASATFSATPYVSFGLSKDIKMGDDSCTDCIYDQISGIVNVQMSWNAGEENLVLNDKTMSLVNGSISGSFSNGMLICRFTRLTYPPSTNTRSKRQTNTDQVFYPGSELYHILIAKGPASSGAKAQHPFHPVASAAKVDFTQFISSSDTQSLSPLIKAHGIMMIFAWMVFASFGILMPRYYKTAWPGKTWGGKAIWFQLHQPLMIITLILTAVAFIIIFVEEEGYSHLDSPAVAHPPLGIVVMALVLINPIMAIFRPDPKSDKRWIFNMLHFLVGLLSHLSAAVALFLATYIQKLGFPEWCRWVMVGYICWHACIEIILAIDMHVTRKKKWTKEEIKKQSSQDPIHEELKSSVESIVLTITGMFLVLVFFIRFSVSAHHYIQKDNERASKYSMFRTTLGVLHLAGVLGCAIALSVQIGIS